MKTNTNKKPAKANPKYTPNKPVYKKKEKKPPKPVISNDLRVNKDKEFKPILVEPTEKYLDIIKSLMKKKYFISAKTGDKIDVRSIKEYHVGKNDSPHIVCEKKKPCPQGGVSITRQTYKIVKFNDQEIVGLESRNTNPWMMKTVDIDQYIKTKESK